MAESNPRNGGEGTYSNTNNSQIQKTSSDISKGMLGEAILEKLDIKSLLSASDTFVIVDMGCSVGPNTFFAVQNVIEAVKEKYHNQCPDSKDPQFQVLFNDLASNDFNKLFTSLPSNQPYFAVGVPGSFYDRLFPSSSIHLVYSSNSLQFLSKAPEELSDRNSPAFNKGKIHYTGASSEVVNAYASQFEKDMGSFLDARAEEIVSGGMIVLIVPVTTDESYDSEASAGAIFTFIGSSLVDMVNEGILSESQVDSFNVPIFFPFPKHITKVVETNASFSIERVETIDFRSKMGNVEAKSLLMHTRANLGGVFAKHFENKVVDEIFSRTLEKSAEIEAWLKIGFQKGSHLFVALKCK